MLVIKILIPTLAFPINATFPNLKKNYYWSELSNNKLTKNIRAVCNMDFSRIFSDEYKEAHESFYDDSFR